MIGRRRTIAGTVATVAACASRAGAAQAPAPLRIGWLSEGRHPFLADFRSGLAALGFSEGHNLVIVERYPPGEPAQLQDLAAELSTAGVDIVVVSGAAAVDGVIRAGLRLPIVFASPLSPLRGRIGNFAHPGGNMSGIALLFDELAAKWPELLHAAFPDLRILGVLDAGTVSAAEQIARIRQTSTVLGLSIEVIAAKEADRLAPAIDEAAGRGANGVIVPSSPLFAANSKVLVEAIDRHRLPAIYEHRAHVAAGGLMSYGPDLAAVFRRLAWYVVQVARGSKVGDLPIEQPSRFELVINLQTARAQSLAVPIAVLSRADEVIE